MAFKHGDPVRIHRPNKQYHGRLGRYTEAAHDPAFAFVAFNNSGSDRLPAEKDLRNQLLSPRKLFPLSQIHPYDNPVNF